MNINIKRLRPPKGMLMGLIEKKIADFLEHFQG
jgi:hypothetical protein